MRRHQIANGTGGSLGDSAAAEETNLQDMGSKLVRDATEALHHLQTHIPKLEVPRIHVPLHTAAGRQKHTTKAEVRPNVTKFDQAWELANHQMNTQLYRCNVLYWKSKCVQGTESGFDGIDARDCWGSCISYGSCSGGSECLDNNQEACQASEALGGGCSWTGKHWGHSGTVARKYAIPSKCFCCEDNKAELKNAGKMLEDGSTTEYTTYSCVFVGTTVPPPYNTNRKTHANHGGAYPDGSDKYYYHEATTAPP